MTNKYLPVEGHPNLVRDSLTNAIINTDFQSSSNYISNKTKRLLEKQKIEDISKELESLKSDINEIKMLLRNISNEPR